MLFSKFIMLSINTSKNNIDDLTFIAIMYFVFIFDLSEMQLTAKKYKLVYCLTYFQQILNYHILYLLHGNIISKVIKVELPKTKNFKNLLIIFSSLKL